MSMGSWRSLSGRRYLFHLPSTQQATCGRPPVSHFADCVGTGLQNCSWTRTDTLLKNIMANKVSMMLVVCYPDRELPAFHRQSATPSAAQQQVKKKTSQENELITIHPPQQNGIVFVVLVRCLALRLVLPVEDGVYWWSQTCCGVCLFLCPCWWFVAFVCCMYFIVRGELGEWASSVLVCVPVSLRTALYVAVFLV